MRREEMNLNAAASALVMCLLSQPVVHGQTDWGVTYSSHQICALKGSTVDIPCTYTYPLRTDELDTRVEETLWFIKLNGSQSVDLRSDPEYSGRVEYLFNQNSCTLKIKNLRDSDSAEYKFMFTTNQQGDGVTGSPGVTLTVTDLQVKVKRSSGPEDDLSPAVYAPKTPSVSVSPAEVVMEGTSVTLNCSSDAKPAATYIWYQILPHNRPIRASPLVFSSIKSSDSGYYYCEAENKLGKKSSEFISITVKYAPRFCSMSVSPTGEIREDSPVTLSCSSDGYPTPEYTWYKKNRYHRKGPKLVFSSVRPSDSGEYYCEAKNEVGLSRAFEAVFLDVKHAPRRPSASMFPPDEIREGSSVTLTCRSYANPEADYTWYKDDDLHLVGRGPQLNLKSILSSDFGLYYCKAENEFGWYKSDFFNIHPYYAPKLPSVFIFPLDEIVEGKNVDLFCNSDANPAASYTWYKKIGDQAFITLEKESHLEFQSIQSSDFGRYYCEAENKLGRSRSEHFNVHPYYPPKFPSVSVSPSGEIVEGSSVTLTCSTDANPAANYTWYKENDNKPKAEGEIFTITDFRAEHSGNYFCEARNIRGRQSSALYQIIQPALTVNLIRLIPLLLMVTPLLLLTLWMRRKKTLSSTTEPNEPAEMIELDSNPEYRNVSVVPAAQTEDTEEQEDVV